MGLEEGKNADQINVANLSLRLVPCSALPQLLLFPVVSYSRASQRFLQLQFWQVVTSPK